MNERKRIWIPEAPYINLKRYVEVDRLDHGVGIEGWFTVELIHARTGLVKRRLRFRNLITNAGLNALGSGTRIGSLIQYLAVGTGSNEPCLVSSIMKGSCDVPVTNPCQVDELSEARVKSSSQSARSGAWYSCLSPLAKGASTRSAVLGFNQMAAAPLRAAVSSATFPPCGR